LGTEESYGAGTWAMRKVIALPWALRKVMALELGHCGKLWRWNLGTAESRSELTGGF